MDRVSAWRRTFEFACRAAIVSWAITSTGTSAQSSGAEIRLGAVSGTVVDATSREPLADALVYLRAGDTEPQTLLTDAKGRFVFQGVRSGPAYSLRVLKVGFLEGQYGQIHGIESTAGSIHLDQGQWLRDLIVRLTPTTSIAGTVRDEDGKPVVGACVRVLRRMPVAFGGAVQWVAGSITKTDDRGAYRISALPPAEYFVQVISVQHALPLGSIPGARDVAASDAAALNQLVVGRYPLPATAPDGRLRVYAPTFWPSSLSLTSAQAVDLRSAERHRSGIDITLLGGIGGRVSGSVTGAPGGYIGVTARLLLPDLEDLGESGAVATSRLNSDGRFTFLNVPPGRFVLDVRSQVTEYSTRRSDGLATATDVTMLRPPGQEAVPAGGIAAPVAGQGVWLYSRTSGEDAYWGRELVSLDEGQAVTDVSVQLQRSSTISAKFVRDGAGPSSTSGLELIAVAADGQAQLGAVRSKPGDRPDSFVISGLAPGRYVLAASPRTRATGVNIKSVRCGSADQTYKPIDTTSFSVPHDCVVTWTDQTTQLDGTIAFDSDESPIIVVFPAEPDQWIDSGPLASRFAQVAPDSNSKFQVRTLPAGDYFVTAASGDNPSAWLEPEALARLATRAVRVRLAWGKSEVVTVRMSK